MKVAQTAGNGKHRDNACWEVHLGYVFGYVDGYVFGYVDGYVF